MSFIYLVFFLLIVPHLNYTFHTYHYLALNLYVLFGLPLKFLCV